MRKEYTMTNEKYEELEAIHAWAVKSVELSIEVRQARVNEFWITLGEELGCDGMTASPVDANYADHHNFTMEVTDA